MFFAARCWSAPFIASAVTPSALAAKATLCGCSICCCHFWGFVYHHAHFTANHKSLEISVRPQNVRPPSARTAISPCPDTTNSPNVLRV